MELRKELSHKPFVLMCLVVRRTGGAAVFYYALGWCVCVRVCVCDARPRCVHRADCSRQWMSLSALSAYQCCRGEPAQEVRNSLQSGEEERRGSQGGLEQSRSAVLCRVLAAKNDPKVGNIYNTPRWTTVHPVNLFSKTALLQYRRRICNLLIYSFLIQSCGQIYFFFPYFPNGMVH